MRRISFIASWTTQLGTTARAPYCIPSPRIRQPGEKEMPEVSDYNTMKERERVRSEERSDAVNARFTLEEVGAPSDGVCIGIDLGTSNSCLSYFDAVKGKPIIIPNKSGSWVYPTIISIQKDHRVRLFGEEARVASKSNPLCTLSSGKRLIGRRFGELSRVVAQHERTNKLVFSGTGEAFIEVQGRTYSVVHITGMFLRHLKHSAEEFLGKPVTQCVVSVPAYFTPAQKVATEDAALIAGYDVLEVVDEPTAACLTYCLLGAKERELEQGDVHRYMVIDLGGGTLDCAVMAHRKGENTLHVVGTHGDPMLGGNDWDSALVQHFKRQFHRASGIELEGDRYIGELKMISFEAEKAKIHMTHHEEYMAHIGAFHFSEEKKDLVPLSVRLDRKTYEFVTRGLVDRCIFNVHTTLTKLGLKASDISSVLYVGGMTRDPPFRKAIEDYFGRPAVASDTCPPDYAVAMGAAIRSAMLLGKLPAMQTSIDFDTTPTNRLHALMHQARQLVGWKTNVRTAVRWRGRATGLSDEDILKFAKEIVEHEAQCARRVFLDKVEESADKVMTRLSKVSSFRQGEMDQQAKLLQEQVKFWQYMVHQFHNHEESLERAVGELNKLLDDLDGVGPGVNTAAVDESGKVKLDPSKVLRKVAAQQLPGKKVDEEMVEHGDRNMKSSRATIPITEETKTSYMVDRLTSMAVFEPPPPPGEEKSVHLAAKVLENVNAIKQHKGELSYLHPTRMDEQPKGTVEATLPGLLEGEVDIISLLDQYRAKYGSPKST